MKQIETVSLIGLGAIGATYLSRMAAVLPFEHIRVVASGARAERLSAEGVIVNGARVRCHVCAPEETGSYPDLLIFAVKFNQLEEAIRDARNQAGPETIILSLLNGVTSERLIEEAYGTKNVLYSFVMGTDATRTGMETVFRSAGHIPFGEARNEPDAHTPRVRRVAEFLSRVGISCEIPADMIRAMWRKFMLNVGLNQLTAVLRAPYSAMQKPGPARELAISTMREAVAVANAEGISLHERDIDECLAIMDTLSPTGKTSMLQDVEAGRPTEVSIFGGTVLALGKQHGIPVPLNETLVRLLNAIETSYLPIQ